MLQWSSRILPEMKFTEIVREKLQKLLIALLYFTKSLPPSPTLLQACRDVISKERATQAASWEKSWHTPNRQPIRDKPDVQRVPFIIMYFSFGLSASTGTFWPIRQSLVTRPVGKTKFAHFSLVTGGLGGRKLRSQAYVLVLVVVGSKFRYVAPKCAQESLAMRSSGGAAKPIFLSQSQVGGKLGEMAQCRFSDCLYTGGWKNIHRCT